MTHKFKPVVAILKINLVVIGIHCHSARRLSLKQIDDGDLDWALRCLLRMSGEPLCDPLASILMDSRRRVRKILAHVKKGAPLKSIYKVTSIGLINQAQLWFLKLLPRCKKPLHATIYNSYQVSLIFYKRKLNTRVFRRVCAYD